jgi:ubiquinone/menaquinone biosynthesis C-methylase UbiE
MNRTDKDIVVDATFEQAYLSLRRKEGRLYTDDEVKMLPKVPRTHHLSNEWKLRTASCKRLIRYLSRKHRPLSILEIGCGNGWLSNQLAAVENFEVTGIDINKTELQQARRVFIRNNLNFFYGDIRHSILGDKFDIIVFASSLQYFNAPNEILNCSLDILKPEGEIHIIDTKFYQEKESFAAKLRSNAYFNASDAPAMHGFYFHHTIDSLAGFNYSVLFNPNSYIAKLLKHHPFHWIRIKHSC